MIKTEKKYENLITFGCSFTSGHQLGERGSWGYALAKHLNCNHINKAGGASNTNILTNVLNYCENNDMSNSCIGIQWSEVTRREFWDEANSKYYTMGLGTFSDAHAHKNLNPENNNYNALKLIFDNLTFFNDMWFNLAECTLRTIVAMISAKAYLKSKNIDFIMFEGINSIKNINKAFYPENYKTDIPHYNKDQTNNFELLNDEVKESILSDVTFYSELGDWMGAMYKHPDFDTSLNDGHPNQEIVDWWVSNIYNYLKKSEQ